VKAFKKTLTAILFAFPLIQILLLLMKQKSFEISDFRIIALTAGAAAIYYFIFERKKNKPNSN
jgi:glycopeptide antibiotics resistance protein